MPRSRNIKYAFFTNDELAEIDPLGRLLFIGLWTLADHKGELEWRPKKIKAELLPYDNCDVEKLAINLDKYGFIRFYSRSNRTYVNIINFIKHQNPHKNERDKGSDVPEYSEEARQAVDIKGLAINPDSIEINREDSASDRADSFILNPDSLSPIPDSQLPESSQRTMPSKLDVPQDHVVVFDYWVLVMSKGKSTQLTKKRMANIKARLKDGYTVDDIRRAIDGCKLDPFSQGDNDRKTPYNDIELITRTGEKLESFIDMAANPVSETKTQREQEADDWASGMNQQSGQFFDNDTRVVGNG